MDTQVIPEPYLPDHATIALKMRIDILFPLAIPVWTPTLLASLQPQSLPTLSCYLGSSHSWVVRSIIEESLITFGVPSACLLCLTDKPNHWNQSHSFEDTLRSIPSAGSDTELWFLPHHLLHEPMKQGPQQPFWGTHLTRTTVAIQPLSHWPCRGHIWLNGGRYGVSTYGPPPSSLSHVEK